MDEKVFRADRGIDCFIYRTTLWRVKFPPGILKVVLVVVTRDSLHMKYSDMNLRELDLSSSFFIRVKCVTLRL